MLKIERTVLPSPEQWEIIIEGLRNPMNSWDKMDSDYRNVLERVCDACPESNLPFGRDCEDCDINAIPRDKFLLGPNDLGLMKKLAKGGAVHAKYRRMIPLYVTITAPLYWWKEFDTYKVGTVANSCSTMHKIHAKEFTIDDFSHEHLLDSYDDELELVDQNGIGTKILVTTKSMMEIIMNTLNYYRQMYIDTKEKKYWWQMIQLLPTSYNQKRTVMLNYEVLVGMYRDRKAHKLDEWHTFCDWIEGLPYSELITGKGE